MQKEPGKTNEKQKEPKRARENQNQPERSWNTQFLFLHSPHGRESELRYWPGYTLTEADTLVQANANGETIGDVTAMPGRAGRRHKARSQGPNWVTTTQQTFP